MTRSRSSHHRSTLTCAFGLALAAASPMGCDAGDPRVEDTPSLVTSQVLQVDYTPDQDTWMRRAAAVVDWGTSHELRTNNVDLDGPHKAILVHFPINLAAVCPTLVAATLSLQSAQLAGPLRVAAHRIGSAWTPGDTGAVPNMPDCAVDSGDSAPFDPPGFFQAVAETTVNAGCTRYTWDVTPIVQAWCAAPSTNFGIRLDGRGSVDNDVNFFSMEALPDRRPTLTIQYSALATASAVAPTK